MDLGDYPELISVIKGFDDLSGREQTNVFKFAIAFCAIFGLLAYLFVDWFNSR